VIWAVPACHSSEHERVAGAAGQLDQWTHRQSGMPGRKPVEAAAVWCLRPGRPVPRGEFGRLPGSVQVNAPEEPPLFLRRIKERSGF
jgi:hypothetical protein